MASVDNRIVEMTFDNAAFERKMATTISSLAQLQKSLDLAGTTKGLESVSTAAKNFDVSRMATAVDSISSRFTALGAIGFTVIQNLTNSVMDFVTGTVSRISGMVIDPLLSGGKQRALNIEQAKFLFRGLEMDIEQSMESARLAVTGTAYGLDVAAKAAAQLGGSGLRAGEDMTSALRGIAGIAAMTNSSYEEMADIFISAAGNGVVMSNELGRISHRGVNAAAALAKQWGITESEVRNMASEGEISFEMFYKAMDGAFGEHATKANETYTGSLANMRAALSRIGASLFVDRLEQQRDLFNALTPVIDNIHTAVKPLIAAFVELTDTGVESLIEKIGNIDLSNFRYFVIPNFTAALENSFEGLSRIIAPIKEAFRDIFPERASSLLYQFSVRLEMLTQKLLINGETAENIKTIFSGLFAAISIGWEVITELAGAIGELFTHFTKDIDGGGVLDFFLNLADSLVALKESLVDGGGIAEFFDELVETIKDPMPLLLEFKETLMGVYDEIMKVVRDPKPHLEELKATLLETFDKFKAPLLPYLEEIRTKIEEIKENIKERLDELKESILGFFEDQGIDTDKITEPFARLEQRFSGLKETFTTFPDVPGWLSTGLETIKGILVTVGDAILNWFSNLGTDMADSMEPGDFDSVLDALNLGLLGGLALLIKKFMDDGLNINLGGGVIESITNSFDALTGKLQAMQTSLKADALLKIAGAIAILTASVLVLSLIDSAALTRALTAMTVGFGQLVGTMQLMNQMTMGPKGAATMSVLAGAMILLSGAVLLLSVAVKNLSGMNWEELTKGLIGVTILLGVIVQTAKGLQGQTSGLITAGLGIIAISIALNILALAMKIFATMSWEEMGKGLLGVAGGLAAIVLAVNNMPKGMAAKGVGILLIAVALNAIAASMKIFATMSWDDMNKGILGVAGGLLAIAVAMHLMPKGMLMQAAALLVVSVALNALAAAIKLMGSMSWSEIGKGLVTLAGAMLVLAIGLHAMSGALAGAAALAIVASSLWLLIKVIQEFGDMSLGEILKGLLGFAGVIAVLAGASMLLAPAIVPMLGLGAAILLLGAGFALFGLGAQAVVKAIELLVKVGGAGIEVFMQLIESLIGVVPSLIGAFAQGLIELAGVFLDAAPVLIEQVTIIIEHLLQAVIDLTPKFAEALTVMITSFLQVIRDTGPDWIATGLEILLALLAGIRDNIEEIVSVVADIVTGFLGAVEAEIPGMVDSVVSFFQTLFTEVARGLGELAPTLFVGVGRSFLEGLWTGIKEEATKLWENLKGIVTGAIDVVKSGFGIFSPSRVMMDIGKDIITGLLNGIIDAAVAVTTWFTELAGKVLGWIGSVIGTLAGKGTDLITGLLTGITNKATELWSWLTALPGAIKDAIGSLFETLSTHGTNLVIGLKNAIITKAGELWDWLSGIPGKIIDAVGSLYETLKSAGHNLVIGLKNGLIEKWGELTSWVSDKIDDLKSRITNPLGIWSPSRFMIDVGENIVEGLVIGLRDNIHKPMHEMTNMTDNMQTALSRGMTELQAAADDIDNSIDMKITPVLDLSVLRRDSKALTSMLPSNGYAYGQAINIASTELGVDDDLMAESGPREVKFEQNLYSPESLSTAEIYRQTRNQITLAKEELSIP